ncbi:PPOX class F420-dependent oxidoreductase [Mycolicibacterium bacteremicum]|jgi:PPOX class probable F420-dependent enzyme|uniref:PPOX class F420-dependent oxidoreductase n=1 Tax=Mycolicibacterium bacteremicum TaxID=564198 RepID=UPI0026EBFFB0|nr:PPOX class F420-dependent oxidoreductase [Mycolicibacterium bacteremicum]
MAEPGDVQESRYVLLSTFRKDGSAVVSPVWSAAESGQLFVWTETDSLKVKRIRRNPTVMLQPCTFRGKPCGVAVSGHAELLDDAGTAHVRTLLARQHGVLGWLAVRWPWPSYFRPSRRLIYELVTGRRPATIEIAITLDQYSSH